MHADLAANGGSGLASEVALLDRHRSYSVDASGLLVALIVAALSQRLTTSQWTGGGFKRVEVLAAPVQLTLLASGWGICGGGGSASVICPVRCTIGRAADIRCGWLGSKPYWITGALVTS